MTTPKKFFFQENIASCTRKIIGANEEYIMANKKRRYPSHFDVVNIASDCSTLSASEVDDDYDVYDPTPPLFYKLKKARVMIKKLPRHVLAKYDMISWKKSSLSSQPSRSSGRIKGKHIPAGQYLALHKNKPLENIMSKKKRLSLKPLKIAENDKREKQKLLIEKKKHSLNTCNSKSSVKKSYFNSENLSRTLPAILKNNSKNKSSLPVLNITNTKPAGNTRSLFERIATTRPKEKPTDSHLPNLPDVVITRYDIPPASTNHFVLNKCNAAQTAAHSSTLGYNSLQNTATISQPTPSNPRNVQSEVFPAFITPAAAAKQNCYHVLPSSAAAMQTPRKFTIKSVKAVKDFSMPNGPLNSQKVFIVNQSPSPIDPLDTPNFGEKIPKNRDRKITKANIADNLASDFFLEQLDAEKEVEPEVIKRIIYHTKSVQTKFTCNSSICGLIDSDEFNLNCFYCYDIFPLHKWYEFKEHIKIVHQVEESANISDSELDDTDTSYTQNRSENLSTPRYSHEKYKGTVNTSNATEPVYQKLPLEPRLLAQRQNKMFTEPAKQILSSTPKNSSQPSKIANPSRNLENISKSNLPCVSFNTSPIAEIINLDSDDCDLDVGDLDDATKTAKRDVPSANRKIVYIKPQTSDTATQVNDSESTQLLLPSLPHITIKKVEKDSPKEKIYTSRTASVSKKPFKEKFIKIPSTTNIQKLIKTLPRPTAKQLSQNAETRPRYFVVKKIIKLPQTDETSRPADADFNIPKGTILTKMQLESKKHNNTTASADGFTDKVEDSVPKPSNGLGILFGLTNTMVVIEFLLKLKTFPELWRAGLKTKDPTQYHDSLKKLCLHINNRFGLNMTEFEMRLSIQRVKDWYYLMLQSIHEHFKGPQRTEPYPHRFPIYFKILKQYLTPDTTNDDDKGHLLNEIISKTKLEAQAQNMANLDANIIQPTMIDTPTIEPTNKDDDDGQNPEVKADNSLIEFDADTLYDQESSEEEVLEAFDESVFFNKKPKRTLKMDGTPRKRTKVYLGRFECDICHKIFKRTCDLKRHKVLHQPPEFECGRCLRKFHFKHWAEKCAHNGQKKGSYQRVDKTSGEKRIWPKKIFQFHMICEICGNAYRSIGTLNTHRKDKHFNQRHKCVVCNFTALSNWLVVRHQRKCHIVEPGLPEDVAKKSRPRTECKTTFSREARQAFDWKREMRKKMKPGEKFHGCVRCKIIFNTRKEKVLHNKIEHPITEFTVICLMCLPNKLLLSNANCARRHYTDIHKVPWHEIDALVKRTKPIFQYLNNDEIELLKASENYKELVDELLKDKELIAAVNNVHSAEDEAAKAVENLPPKNNAELEEATANIQVECSQQENNVYVDGIVDDYENNNDNNCKNTVCTSRSTYEHNYSEEQVVVNESFDNFVDVVVAGSQADEFYSQQSCEAAEEETITVDNNMEVGDKRIQNDDEYVETIFEDFAEGELVEESLVVEEYIDEVIEEDVDDEEMFDQT